ncbi:DUF4349 domain-containing protein [Croceicoccus naphthovorans]|nr:DUF4349 domain-containing protein [Croceicoccus naphthovorans]MBB3990571.1 hypothetical protein [Croceicoccus naphthovorans]
MRRIDLAKLAAGPVLVLVVTGCESGGRVSDSSEMTSADIAEPAAVEERMNAGEDSSADEIAVSLPKIAYVYSFGYRLSPNAIAPLQMAQADLCEAQGPRTCRILDMRQAGMEGQFSSGSLTLAVAAPQARAFGAKLMTLADDAGGSQISSAIGGEDLSKQIVDTEARVRARTILRDRLLEVLATRKGTVAELVEAERAVARVNEEIDQAKGWLAEMRQRVDYSRMEITYRSGMPETGGFMTPVRQAISSIAAILGNMLAFAVVALTVLLPLGLVGWAVWRLVRRLRHAEGTALENPRSP